MGAVCDKTVDTPVVSVFTMGARGRGDVIFPKRVMTLWGGDRSWPWRMMFQGVEGAARGGGGVWTHTLSYLSERS